MKVLTRIAIDYLKKCFNGLSQEEIGDLNRIHEHILKNLKAKEERR